MPYTHFRVIAYQVPTASGGGNPVISGWNPGVAPDKVPTIPVPDSLPDDARIRLRRLATMVRSAYTQLQSPVMANNANTLKVFLVPEFYLRPPSTVGPDYTAGTYPVHVRAQILDALNEMFVDADYKDWLVVAGTVMWNTIAPVDPSDPTPTTLYFNTIVAVRGGRADGLYVIEKRVPSHIDGVPLVTFGGATNWGGPGYDPKLGPFLESWKVRKQHVLMVDGVRIGVEVCLDHADRPNLKVLKRVVRDWSSYEGFFAKANCQLHLLPAGGMPIELGSIAAKVGGYIIRNDGIANAGTRVEMHRITGYTPNFWSDEEQLNSKATLTQVNPLRPLPVAPATGALLPNPPAPYPTITQQLVFFPTTALP